MLLIKNANVVTEQCVLAETDILIEGNSIKNIGEGLVPNPSGSDECIDASECYAVPGFVGCHNHGGGGADTTDGSLESIETIINTHLLKGTTSIFLTTMAQPKESLIRNLSVLGEYITSHNKTGMYLAVHTEGPFLNPRFQGMYSKECIIPPDKKTVEEFINASGDTIRMMTLAPELDGMMDIIELLSSHNIVSSMGHTEANKEQIQSAVAKGLSHVTHLFNAMPPIHHRSPGTIVNALLEPALHVQLIADGIHLHPDIMTLAIRVAGIDRVILVSDAMRAAGMPEGRYMLGDSEEVVYKDGAVRSERGNLASTGLTLDICFRNIMSMCGISIVDAAKMTSLNPAKNLHIDAKKGSITSGKDADIVIMDADFNVKHVVCMGNRVK